MSQFFGYLWGSWLLAFVLIEAAAIMRGGPGDTFSEFIWAFLGGGWSRYFLLGGLLIWMTIHFLGRGKVG